MWKKSREEQEERKLEKCNKKEFLKNGERTRKGQWKDIKNKEENYKRKRENLNDERRSG